MGAGGGPPWFSQEFPSLAAKREPFPEVERWQSAYVRYALSEETRQECWNAEACRRNLRNVGRHEHPILLGQANMPESATMRIVEAPAEFALPVKQDRRLLPCFKVRLEVKHRAPLSMPVTLRAHVLTQQDREHLTSWSPLEEGSTDGQKAVTELKGTSVIRGVLEAGDDARSGSSSGQARRPAAGGRDPAAGTSGSAAPSAAVNGANGAARNGSAAVKVEPTSSFSFGASASGLGGPSSPSFPGVAAGGLAPVPNGADAAAAGGMAGPLNPQAQQLLDSYNLANTPGISSDAEMRDVGSSGLLREVHSPATMQPPRDVNLTSLFAANRPDPVVTLASSGRLSGTGSSLPSFSSGAGLSVSSGGVPQQPGLLGGGGAAGLRVGAGTGPGDSFDAAVEMVMGPSQQQQQQQQQQRRPSPLAGGALLGVDVGNGGPLMLGGGGMPRGQQQAAQQQAERGWPTSPPGGSSGVDSGKLMTTTQDFEFTNLEFLKPTRMNKVFMAFTASLLDTDMLLVVFEVPTIGICRAEQREKACKKLSIDYKLLSHFDQSVGGERPAASGIPAAAAAAVAAIQARGLGEASGGAGGSGGMGMPQLSDSSKPLTPPLPHQQHQQQQQPQPQQHPQQLLQSRSCQGMELKMAQQMQMQGCGSPAAMMAARMGQLHHDPKVHAGPPSDVDFPRLGMAENGMHGAGMLGGPMVNGGGMIYAGGGGGMLPPGMGMHGMLPAGMHAAGMGCSGPMGGAGAMHRGGMGCDANASAVEFFLGHGGSMANNGMAPAMGSMGGLRGQGSMEFGFNNMMVNSRKRDQGQKEDDNYRFHPVPPGLPSAEPPPYTGFMGLTSSDMDMLLPAPHSRMAMRDFIHEVYDSTGLNRKLTHMDMQALLSQAGFPMDSNREHDTISPQQWDEFCAQFRNIVGTLQQIASVWNMDDPVVISGFDMDRVGTITALANEPAGTFVCRFSMSQPGCLVLTCKVGPAHPRADGMGLIHAIIKIDDLHERRVDTWIRDYAGATHLLDVYRQKRVDKRKVFATNYTRLRGLEMEMGPVEQQSPFGAPQAQGQPQGFA